MEEERKGAFLRFVRSMVSAFFIFLRLEYVTRRRFLGMEKVILCDVV